MSTPLISKSTNSSQVNTELLAPKSKDAPDKGKPKKPTAESHCKTCNVAFDDDNCVMCECCKAWHHAACVGLTEDEIAAFALLGPKAHWYCDKCDAGAKELYVQHVEFKSRLDKLEKTVSDVKSDNKTLNKDISKLKSDTKKDREDIDQLFADNKNIKIENKTNSDLVKNIDQSVTELKAQQAENTESLKI